MKPNKRCILKTGVGVGRKGSRLKIKAGGGVQGGGPNKGAAPHPAMRSKKEVHRHKFR